MRLASAGGIGLVERERFRLFRFRKRIRQFFKFKPGETKTVLFIVGCQRSGTSMIHHLFRLDPDTVTYDEVSPLSSWDKVEGLRLKPLDWVKARIDGDRAPLVVCKPLVESQNLNGLLGLFPESRAIWMYRDFRAVVLSNLKFFGPRTGHRDLASIIADDQSDWRAQNLAPEDRDIIRDLYAPDIDPHDAAALFWYARNSLYFSRGFAKDTRIRLCRYETLVTEPSKVMRESYAFVGRPYPGDSIVADVFSASRGRGRDLELSPPVRELCQALLNRLDQALAAPVGID